MCNRKAVLLVAGLALAAGQYANAAAITSSFDVDGEGWVANPGEGALNFVATGGNPGGHIRITDIGIGGVPFGSGAFAGPAVLGDLSAFDGGTISLDMATFAGFGGTFASFGELQLSGGGDIALLDIAVSAPSPAGVWQTFSAGFDAASWGKSQSEWLAIISDVSSLGVPTDAFDGADTIGIDNFTIERQTIPDPPTMALFGFGLVALRYLQKRKG